MCITLPVPHDAERAKVAGAIFSIGKQRTSRTRTRCLLIRPGDSIEKQVEYVAIQTRFFPFASSFGA